MTKKRTMARICPQCGEDYEGDVEFCPDDGTRLRDFAFSDQDEDPLIGEDIDGRFEVLGILGEGGMGKVYRGKQLSVNRDVAIKVLRKELAGDQTLVKRFFREAQVISQFSHPNIVSLVDFGQDVERDVLYLAMEFIDGVELSDLLEGHRLAPEFVVEVLIQACEALSEAHAKGVTHRDLKPENLMLVSIAGGRIQAKVVDFGIAHALQHEEKLTQTGSVFGTAHYMAPEQASGGEITESTDVYALGCILYELLTGEEPFKAESPMGLLMKHVEADPPVLARYFPESDDLDELSELVVQMMKKNAEARPDSVLDVRDRLEEIQRTHNYPRLRVDPDEGSEAMFAQWQYEAVSTDMAAPGAAGRATNAPRTAPPTGEHPDTGAVDEVAPASTQEATDVAFDQTAAMQTGEAVAAESPAETAQNAQQRTSTSSDHMTDMTDLAVQPSGGYKKLILPLVGILVMLGLVVGLVVALILGDDAADDVAEEAGDATAQAVDDGDDAPDEPEEVADDGASDDEDDDVDELADADEAMDDDNPDEETSEGDDADAEDEAAGDEVAADEPSDEPAPARPDPTPTPTPDPEPAEEQPTQPAATPPAQDEPVAADDDDDGAELDIFTVD